MWMVLHGLSVAPSSQRGSNFEGCGKQSITTVATLVRIVSRVVLEASKRQLFPESLG